MRELSETDLSVLLVAESTSGVAVRVVENIFSDVSLWAVELFVPQSGLLLFRMPWGGSLPACASSIQAAIRDTILLFRHDAQAPIYRPRPGVCGPRWTRGMRPSRLWWVTQ